MLPLLILGDIAICVALYFLMGWPALLFAVPLAITTIIIFVVLQGTAMLRQAVQTRSQGAHQVVDGSTYDSSRSGPADWDDTFDTFSAGPSTWDDQGQSHHSSTSHDHHWHSHSSSHDPGSWSSDSGSSSGSSDSGSSSSSDSGSSSSSDSGSSSSSDSGSSSSSSD
ncbi:hypothetical protein ACFFOU_31260 [Pseudonocardia sulfidoxydans]|uniref:hypothetical protein n=1 Tax=Pseudonocardia sulfidoxydans TaxID=54011 RepID=UPI0035E65CDC